MPSKKHIIQKMNQLDKDLKRLKEDVDSHYNYKLYKSKSKYTIYDTELDKSEFHKKEVELQQKREEEAFENLGKKLKEIQAELPDHRDGLVEDEEEEEEEEDDEVVVHKSQQPKGAQPKAKDGKMSKAGMLAEKEKMLKLQKQFATIKTCMATSQDKLVNLQKELDELDTKILVYKGYQQANWYYLDHMRTIVLSYEKTNDIHELIRSLDTLHSEYNALRRRAAPKGVCSGERNLCGTHYLPLSPQKFTEKGEPYNFRCILYPVA
jgi:hypothetical protein